MRPKNISRDQQRIRAALKHGHDAGMKVALEIVERQEAAAKRPPSRALRKQLISDDTDHAWPVPMVLRSVRKYFEKEI
jgi:hypothetical protein